VAFIQGTGIISQSLMGLVSGAVYQVTFSAAQRNNIYGQQAGQTWQLQLDGTAIGTYAPAESAQSYVDYTATFTASSSGSHTLAFVGTNTHGGDNTIFLDNVRLAPLPSLVQPRLAWQVADGQFQILWPPDHTGWSLLVQTNPLNSDWAPIGCRAGSALTNQFVSPISRGNGSVFFRLTYPYNG